MRSCMFKDVQSLLSGLLSRFLSFFLPKFSLQYLAEAFTQSRYAGKTGAFALPTLVLTPN